VLRYAVFGGQGGPSAFNQLCVVDGHFSQKFTIGEGIKSGSFDFV
jgi:hypothetical protein